jgi:hypothetical protein
MKKLELRTIEIGKLTLYLGLMLLSGDKLATDKSVIHIFLYLALVVVCAIGTFNLVELSKMRSYRKGYLKGWAEYEEQKTKTENIFKK